MPFYLGRKAIRKVPGAVIKAAPLPEPELMEGFGKRSAGGYTTKSPSSELMTSKICSSWPVRALT